MVVVVAIVVVVSSSKQAFCGWMCRHLALFGRWVPILSSLVYVSFLFYFNVINGQRLP